MQNPRKIKIHELSMNIPDVYMLCPSPSKDFIITLKINWEWKTHKLITNRDAEIPGNSEGNVLPVSKGIPRESNVNFLPAYWRPNVTFHPKIESL